jgi:hypothetical protein
VDHDTARATDKAVEEFVDHNRLENQYEPRHHAHHTGTVRSCPRPRQERDEHEERLVRPDLDPGDAPDGE